MKCQPQGSKYEAFVPEGGGRTRARSAARRTFISRVPRPHSESP